MYSTSLLFLLVWLIIQSTLSYYIQDQIVSLPGWYSLFPSPQYSGYLSFIDPAGSGARLYYHYWLSLAEISPETAPLLYWSNGGPGCSSMEGTFFEGGYNNIRSYIVIVILINVAIQVHLKLILEQTLPILYLFAQNVGRDLQMFFTSKLLLASVLATEMIETTQITTMKILH